LRRHTSSSRVSEMVFSRLRSRLDAPEAETAKSRMEGLVCYKAFRKLI
jgi:hypothetical protein